MAQRKIPYLKVVEPPENPKQLKKAERKVRWKKWEGAVSILILAVLAICGTYLLLDNKTYGTAREAASYTKEISDTSNYVQFAKGIITNTHKPKQEIKIANPVKPPINTPKASS